MIDHQRELPEQHGGRSAPPEDVGGPTFRSPEEVRLAVRGLRDLLDDTDVPVLVLTRNGLDPDAARDLLDALEDTGLLGVLLGADEVLPISRTSRHLDEQLGHLADLLVGGPSGSAATPLETEAPSSVAARASGLRPLAEADPERWRVCLAAYRSLLVASLEQRAYRITRSLRPGLLALAGDLAELRADPRDCVRLQTETLRQLGNTEDPSLVEVARDEGMVLLVELLGYLARAYRDGRHRRPVPPRMGADASQE